jgi:hypothetical protein
VVKGMLTIPGVKKTNTYVILSLIKDPFKFIPNFEDNSEGEKQVHRRGK